MPLRYIQPSQFEVVEPAPGAEHYHRSLREGENLLLEVDHGPYKSWILCLDQREMEQAIQDTLCNSRRQTFFIVRLTEVIGE